MIRQGPCAMILHSPAQPRRILVVDDNLDTVSTMTRLLRRLGHEVCCAVNGYAALDVARRFRPDVVVLDLGLPDADGVDIARQMKRDPQCRNARILALTGRNRSYDELRSLDAGCEEYLLKPLDPKILEQLIERQ